MTLALQADVQQLTEATNTLIQTCTELKDGVADEIEARLLEAENSSISPMLSMASGFIQMSASFITNITPET